jgi:hypothetical protein
MEMFWSFVGGMIIGMMLLALIIAGMVGDE